MHIGAVVRNMGDQSTSQTMGACAAAAEAAGLESVWVVDHVAIPPEDAEGSNGRYVDPLIALAWLAGSTTTIRLGVGTLVLPYRPALPVAKQIASIQELSGERLLLGVGIGWMEAEFRALGVERRRRGRISDATLAFIHECFERDEVTARGQPILFRPPTCPPPHLRRRSRAPRIAAGRRLRRRLAADRHDAGAAAAGTDGVRRSLRRGGAGDG